MTLILAIDQGTSSSRGIVFDMADGRIAGVGQRAFDMVFPQDGWVEQDPETLWRTTLEASREALAAAGAAAQDIAAIGITNQRETTLVWDRESGECVHNAIVWQDRRTADRCRQMAADGLAESVRAKTGLVLDPLLFRHQARLAARPSAGTASPGSGRRALLRHRGQLPALATHRRPRPFDRRHQRFENPVVRTSITSAGIRNCCTTSTFPPPCCPKSATAPMPSAWLMPSGSAPRFP